MDQVESTQINSTTLPNVISGFYKYTPYCIQMVVMTISWPFLRFFMHCEVEGVGNIFDLSTNNAIFASNHSSELDPLLVTIVLRKIHKFLPMFYVSREKSFYKNSSWRQMIYGGIIFKMCGAYPIYVGQHDYEKSLRNHISILENGYSICIFPEGKKSNDGAMREARGGIGYLSFRTKTPIIPITISGVYNFTFKDFILRKRFLKIIVNKPIFTQELFSDLNDLSVSTEYNVYKTAGKKIMTEISKSL
jgi:1-acyl-sn-glycerol-3-phosphate acyltransferase